MVLAQVDRSGAAFPRFGRGRPLLWRPVMGTDPIASDHVVAITFDAR